MLKILLFRLCHFCIWQVSRFLMKYTALGSKPTLQWANSKLSKIWKKLHQLIECYRLKRRIYTWDEEFPAKNRAAMICKTKNFFIFLSMVFSTFYFFSNFRYWASNYQSLSDITPIKCLKGLKPQKLLFVTRQSLWKLPPLKSMRPPKTYIGCLKLWYDKLVLSPSKSP